MTDYSHMKLVLIDDNDMVRQSLQNALSEFDFIVQSYQDPLAALDWIKDNGADIVISDICMPLCDGFEVLKKVKEIDRNCDVIFITAHGQMDTAIRALREGAADFFEKPFTTEALNAAIERTSRFKLLAKQNEILNQKVDILSSELRSKLNQRNAILGKSDEIKKIAESIVNVASTNATVLITGESGTGKELVARSIHAASNRHDKPFLTVNCPSVPEELFESEIFGHRKGAFTGAIETKSGYVGAAEGGTLFLDEIGDLPLRSQAKILRLLEQKTYLPVGENLEKNADVRIIAATNQRLEALVSEKMFREDLLYRLNVCSIELPPLRSRKADIPLLAQHFVLQFALEMGKSIEGISDKALAVLSNYNFPGNIRELRNIAESSVIHCRHEGELLPDDLPQALSGTEATANSNDWGFKSMNLDEVNRQLIKEVLRQSNNNVSAASRLLGISRGKLRRALESLNIEC